jgi:hypothetical protein
MHATDFVYQLPIYMRDYRSCCSRPSDLLMGGTTAVPHPQHHHSSGCALVHQQYCCGWHQDSPAFQPAASASACIIWAPVYTLVLLQLWLKEGGSWEPQVR